MTCIIFQPVSFVIRDYNTEIGPNRESYDVRLGVALMALPLWINFIDSGKLREFDYSLQRSIRRDSASLVWSLAWRQAQLWKIDPFLFSPLFTFLLL